MVQVYILQSLKDKRTYVGFSKNAQKRFLEHCAGKVLSTRNRRPLKLLLIEDFASSKDAKKCELWWKSGAGRRQLKKIYRSFE